MLGQKDLEFLGKAYAFYFAAVPWAMLRVKNAVVAGVPADLTSVWKVFAGYQIVRCAMFAGRSLLLSKRARREFSAAQSLIKVIDDVGVHKVGKSMTEVDGLVDRAHSFSEEIVAA